MSLASAIVKTYMNDLGSATSRVVLIPDKHISAQSPPPSTAMSARISQNLFASVVICAGPKSDRHRYMVNITNMTQCKGVRYIKNGPAILSFNLQQLFP